MTQMDVQPPVTDATGPTPVAARPGQQGTPIVEMNDISIAFGGVPALSEASLRLFPGEVHALMGENGAGKSTMIKALTGVYSIDSGTVHVAGIERTFTSPAASQEAGISTVYQEINLCTNLTVAENMMLGREPRTRLGGINTRAMNRQAKAPSTGSVSTSIRPRSWDSTRSPCSSSSPSPGPSTWTARS